VERGQPALGLLVEDRSVSRRTTALAAGLLAALLAVAGCSSGDDPEAQKTTPSPSAPAAPPAAPPARACYDLSFAEATAPTSTADPVPCTAEHTAATIRVGTIRPVVDGHLQAVDSDAVQQQIATRCRARLASYLGGDEEARRLSRLTVVWFSPSLAQSDRGALWFRCDLVALAGHDELAPLPRRTRGLLDAGDALDRFGTCGTASPAASRFERVICSAPHTWRARASIDLPKGSKYLGKAADAAAVASCRDIEARLASDILKLKWSFEWPTQAQWDTGQRYGFCWTPDPA
jgi:hypothetical protein